MAAKKIRRKLEFDKKVIWKQISTKPPMRVPEPQPGNYPEFDKVNTQIDKIREALDAHLEECREVIDCPALKFVFVSYNFKYQM